MSSVTDVLASELSALDDEQLRRLIAHAAAFVEAVNDDPLVDQDTRSAAFGLYVLAAKVADDRSLLEEHARIALEANGHQVWVDHDPNALGSEGGWWAYCHCLSTPTGEPIPGGPSSLGTGVYVSREEAATVAADHAAEHGGAWSEWTH